MEAVFTLAEQQQVCKASVGKHKLLRNKQAARETNCSVTKAGHARTHFENSLYSFIMIVASSSLRYKQSFQTCKDAAI